MFTWIYSKKSNRRRLLLITYTIHTEKSCNNSLKVYLYSFFFCNTSLSQSVRILERIILISSLIPPWVWGFFVSEGVGGSGTFFQYLFLSHFLHKHFDHCSKNYYTTPADNSCDENGLNHILHGSYFEFMHNISAINDFCINCYFNCCSSFLAST